MDWVRSWFKGPDPCEICKGECNNDLAQFFFSKISLEDLKAKAEKCITNCEKCDLEMVKRTGNSDIWVRKIIDSFNKKTGDVPSSEIYDPFEEGYLKGMARGKSADSDDQTTSKPPELKSIDYKKRIENFSETRIAKEILAGKYGFLKYKYMNKSVTDYSSYLNYKDNIIFQLKSPIKEEMIKILINLYESIPDGTPFDKVFETVDNWVVIGGLPTLA